MRHSNLIDHYENQIYPNHTLSNTMLDTLVQFSSVTQSCPTLCDPMNQVINYGY